MPVISRVLSVILRIAEIGFGAVWFQTQFHASIHEPKLTLTGGRRYNRLVPPQVR